MSRRKQATPRALLKSAVAEPELDIVENSEDEMEGSVVSSWTSSLDNTADEENSLSSCDTPTDFTIGPTEATPYTCQFCDKAFPRLSYLKKHEQSHSDQMPFKCDFCQRLFKHKRSRDRHVKLHTGDKKYRCPHCESAFSRSDHLKIHLKTHDHQKPYQCVVCNRGYNTAAALTSHMQNHKKESICNSNTPSPAGQFRCLQCNGTFITGEELQTHITNSHSLITIPILEKPPSPKIESKLTCIYCAKDTFNSIEALQLHVQALHGPLPTTSSPSSSTSSLSPCNFCTMKFPNLTQLNKHITTIHNYNYIQKAKENVFCATCSLAFPNTNTYTEHFLLFHSFSQKRSISPQENPTDLSKKSPIKKPRPNTPPTINNLICNQCNAGFSDFESFRTHLKTHLEEVVKKYSCDECESVFLTEDQLEQHVLIHYLSTSIEYGCQSCLKSFTKPDELQKHLLDIHAHHLFKCNLCMEVFDSKVAIQVHFAVKHSNESKQFRCTKCSNVSRSEAEFQLHIRLNHSSQRNHRCLLCLQLFQSETELTSHIQTHKRTFKCNFCPEAFHVEFLLDKHNQSQHQINQNGKKKKTKCDICDQIFTTETEVLNHRKSVHHVTLETDSDSKPKNPRINLNCAYCNELCKSRSDLENHMKTHQIIGKNKCNICDEIFPTQTLLSEHKLSHCKVINGNKCSGCNININNEDCFLKHIQLHCNSVPLPCIICRQTLINDIDIKMHSKFHTSNLTLKNQCCLCLKTSNLKTDLKPFICSNCVDMTQKDEKTYECIKCQMSFLSEEEIQSHVVQTHLGSILKCYKCSINFDTPFKLQTHLIGHDFDSTFKCYICEMEFESPNLLQIHINEHSFHTRKFDCEHCHLKFFFKAELNNHFVHSHSDIKLIKRKKFFYREDSDEDV